MSVYDVLLSQLDVMGITGTLFFSRYLQHSREALHWREGIKQLEVKKSPEHPLQKSEDPWSWLQIFSACC